MNFSSNYCNYKASIIGYEGLNFSVRNRKRNAKFNTCLFPLNIHFNSHFIIVLHNQIPFDLIYKKLYNGIKNE